MRPRAGFSMLEVVIALFVLALAAALVTTRASVALDQMSAHAAFQDFQTGLLRLRGEAAASRIATEATAERLPLPVGWSFRSAASLLVDETGACTGGEVELVRGGKARARLTPVTGCRYLRAS